MTSIRRCKLENKDDLECQGWYWGPLTREEAVEILQNYDHGHFLVRDSTSEHEYTLVVRKGNAIRSVRIMKWDGKFGILSSHCNFPSVTSLVNHLLKHPESYKIQFPDLDFHHPVLKPRNERDNLPELMLQVVLKGKELLLKRNDYTNHLQKVKMVAMEIQCSQTTITSLQVVHEMFEEQLRIQTESRRNIMFEDQTTVSSLAMNMAQLHSRLQLIETKLKAEKKHLVDLQAEHHYQMEITEFLNPKLSKLEIEQKQLCRQALEMGILKEYLDLLLMEEECSDTGHFSHSFWLISCNRPKAEELLMDRIPGTFLIRPRESGFALSVVCADGEGTKICHCCICCTQEDRYGFVPEFCLFDSLEELVIKHKTISLRFYNPTLDVCLTYPINYRENDQ
ncbi:phosphatidylinositol 3-kinase regulatory subunit alpha-like [Pomacea canaliculata]|uniref:phosphatidylinositol 3-kinase regulatory subunit alpha-like n=1 Tax=Pomacea canaliculata TaxID=400727 RepID=UPI000D73AA4E|nr:phosphatidylinositol 3-kinase regulatory subunit alpha-like [Pomacea canaliculata]